MDSDSPRLRLSILGVVVLSLFGALFARLWYLQVAASEQFQVEAQSNRVREIFDEAPRGRILDRWGQVLVDNRTSLVVTVSPNDLDASKRRDEVILRLAQRLTSLGVPTKVSTIEARLSDKQYNPLQPIPVAIDVPEDIQVLLAERAEDFPGVDVKRESVRTYPNGSLAAHVLGYVGRISKDELEEKQGTRDAPKVAAKPYEPDSNVGKTGVERAYEDDLRGTPGKCRIEVDAKGKPARRTDCQAPKPGNDVVLSLDLTVQKNAEQALAEQLGGLRGGLTSDGAKINAPAGSTVVMDPRNGQIIAMASYPTYDPAEFVNGIASDRYGQLRTAPDNPLTNRAIAGAYAPGSTFKLITATAALNQGLINANTPYLDTGKYVLGDCDTCTKTNSGGAANGQITVPKALTVSSDTFFYWLGDRYWKERAAHGDGIQATARQYGLGQPTGVPLQGEVSGLILDPDGKKRLHDSNPKAFPDPTWYGGTNVQMAIGQDVILVTPLQLVNAYATFVQNGTRYQPQIAAKVVAPKAAVDDPNGVVRSIDAVASGQVSLPPNVADPIRQGLLGVADKKQAGTAGETFVGWDLKAFPLMSKTGTAQVSGKADTSLYVACGPAANTQYCAVAVLEESGFGADAAGPVVRRVLGPLAGQPPTPPPDPNAEKNGTQPGQPTPTPGVPTPAVRPRGKAD